ncbi:MAG: hypothetical protein JNL74_03590 [Fibrobacteres bacterium]|nr:hypothetical protein [Fibrobacterota bacterium]
MKKTLLIITLLSALTHGLDLKRFYGEPSLQCGAYFKLVSTNDTTAALFALPLVHSFDLSRNLHLDASTVPTAVLTNNESSLTARLSSTKLRLTLNSGNIILSTIGLRIPTAYNRFSEEQTRAMGMVSARQMNVDYSDLYNSTDINLGVASSLYFKDVGDGDLTLALAFSYLYKGATEPLNVTEAFFYPGQEFTSAATAEYVFIAFERRFDITADALYTMFTDDSYAGGETYSRGSIFQWALSLSSSVTAQLPLSIRIANYLRSPSESPLGNTGKASDLFIALSAIPPLSKNFKPDISLSFSSYAAGGLNKYGDAAIITLDGKTEKKITEKVTTLYSAGLEGGTLEGKGILGFTGSATLRFNF